MMEYIENERRRYGYPRIKEGTMIDRPHAETMTCVKVEFDEAFDQNAYTFDNGMKLLDIELFQNFDLWATRGGYVII